MASESWVPLTVATWHGGEISKRMDCCHLSDSCVPRSTSGRTKTQLVCCWLKPSSEGGFMKVIPSQSSFQRAKLVGSHGHKSPNSVRQTRRDTGSDAKCTRETFVVLVAASSYPTR